MNERTRRVSPGGRPQPLAFLGTTLWMGSWDTGHLYAIDPQSWRVTEEVPAPGRPYGIAAFGDELRVVVSLGEEDDRYLYSFVPGQGFVSASKTACPGFSGSHLASDGTMLYLCQQGNERILALDASGAVAREIALTTRCAGLSVRGGACYMLAADEEFENLQLATLDLQISRPVPAPLADVPFEARGLTSGGDAWWTSHREASEIVSFDA